MVHSYENKVNALKVFLLYLINKHQPKEAVSLNLTKSSYVTYYSYSVVSGHSINISEYDFEIFNKYQLCFILAHEFNHYLENQNRIKKAFLGLWADSLFLCMISIFVFIVDFILFNLGFSFWVFAVTPFFYLLLLFNPFKARNRFNEESRCDLFANKEIGGGSQVFIIAQLEEMNYHKPFKFKNKKISNFLEFSLLRTYPLTTDRIKEAEKFPLRSDIKFILDFFNKDFID